MSAKIQTYLFTIFFSLVGAFMVYKNMNAAALPLILFYFILLANTFFSIEFFAKIIPTGRLDQMVIDLFLGAIYLALIMSLGNEPLYILLATILFIVATLRYSLLLEIVDLKILKKKIIIDGFGAIFCSLALAGSLLGHGAVTNWIWTLLFLFANIYLLIIKPMYKI